MYELLKQGGRFVIGGAINTLLTTSLYLILTFWLSGPVSYALSWCVGMAFVVKVYPTKVFGSPTEGVALRIGFIATYVASFAIGLLVVWVVSDFLGREKMAIFAALIITTAFNFITMRLVVSRFSSDKLLSSSGEDS